MEVLGDMVEDMVVVAVVDMAVEELDMEVVVVKEAVLDMELVVNMGQDMVVAVEEEKAVVAAVQLDMVQEESMVLVMEVVKEEVVDMEQVANME